METETVIIGLQRVSIGSFFIECFFNSDVIKQVTLRLIYDHIIDTIR